MMNIFNNHTKLYTAAASLYLLLTFFTAIKPAWDNQKNNGPLPGTKPLSGDALAGKMVYISEGCVACHTQQVRNVDMDKMFGSRPGIPSDYANIGRTSVWANTATLMGTERTGPDLTDVGNRQPSKEWNLLHLYNPRTVVAQSIMPSYKWLFEVKENPGKNDVIVNVPAEFMHGKTGKVVATKKALQLVAYLQSLKQAPLPENVKPNEFLYKQEKKVVAGANSEEVDAVDGKALFASNCQSCHQENGEGLKGAFPSLKGSPIVLGEDLKLIVDIIMNGYDARPEFAVMTPVGTSMNFDEKQLAAIVNYIKTSWGNDAKKVKPDEVKEIMEFIKTNNTTK